MTDLTTPYAGLTKPTVGADDNSWGDILNADLDLIDTFLRSIVPAGLILALGGSSVPTGFLLCNGSAVSRTTYAALFAAIGTTWGSGDGSTTFNVPSLADKFLAGVGATALGGTAGSASFTPTITVAAHALLQVELPNYSLTVSDPGHIHAVADGGHTHGVNDTGHTHGVTDAGHNHAVLNNVDGSFAGSGFGLSGVGSVGITNSSTNANVTGIGIQAGLTFLTISGSFTGIGIASHTTGVTVSSGGGGQGHTHNATSNAVPTLPPYAAVNYIIKT